MSKPSGSVGRVGTFPRVAVSATVGVMGTDEYVGARVHRSGEASRYIFHLEGHVRTVKEELFIVDRKSRAMAMRQVELAESLRAIAAQLPTDGIA